MEEKTLANHHQKELLWLEQKDVGIRGNLHWLIGTYSGDFVGTVNFVN